MTAVWGYSESEGVAREVMSAAEEIALALGGQRVALEVDHERPGARLGEVLVIKGSVPIAGSMELAAEAIARAARKRQPSAVLIGATRSGRIVASKLAVKLRWGCLSEITHVKTDGSSLLGDRGVYAGKASARVRAELPCVATVKVGAYPRGEPASSGADLEDVGPLSPKVRSVQSRQKESGRVDLQSAPIIVSAGRGVKEKGDLRLVEELARTLGGAVGCSRPLSSDYGWLPEENHIGLTGVTVHPALYLALGISGQLQHVAGIKDSKIIAAVNIDREAPIFQTADYGIVGDLYQVVPALLKVLNSKSST